MIVNNSTPQTVLKVPQGLWKKANETGYLDSFVFYMQLKTLNPQGAFRKDQIIAIIKEKFGFCQSAIYKKVDKLIAQGFARKDGAGTLQIKHYNTVWSIIFNVEEKSTYKGMFKLFKFKAEHINDLEAQVSYLELKYNFDQQGYRIKEAEKSTSSGNKKNKDAASKDVLKNITIEQRENNKAIQEFLSAKHGEIMSVYNPEITITCLGFADLMGYKSGSKGYHLEQRLKELGLIDIETRTEPYKMCSSMDEFKSMNLCGAFFLMAGYIYKVLPNLLTLL